jgi:hypothetical protein
MDEVVWFVLFHDFVRDYQKQEVNVFVSVKWIVQIEFVDINAHESGARCGNGAVEYEFGGCEASGVSAHISGVVD